MVLLLLSTAQKICGQSPAIPEITAAANSYLFTTTTSSVVFGNPACADTAVSFGLGAYANRSFLVQELTETGAALMVRLPANTYLSAGCMKKGYSLFSRNYIAIAMSKYFGSSFCAGLRLERTGFVQGENYGSETSWNVAAGALVKISQRMDAASCFKLPVVQQDDKLLGDFSFGLRYRFSGLFSLNAEAALAGNAAVVRGAILYRPRSEIEIVAGIGGKPLMTSFGCVLHLKSLSLLIAAAHVPVTGYSPSVGCSYVNHYNR